MDVMMRALAIAHHFDYDPGMIGVAAAEHGIGLTMVAREDATLPDPTEFDLVISFGSQWSIAAGDEPHAVQREQHLLSCAQHGDVPVLGICFGAQQLAVALGGAVTRSETPEIGLCTIDSIDAGVSSGPWMNFHLDQISPPPGQSVVAATDRVQAFRAGRSLGVQFHPEATTATVTRWLDHGADAYLASVGLTRGSLLQQIEARSEGAQERTTALFTYFLTSAGIN
jgi:GMP synthase-like glutamine amidotransferase